MKKSSVLIIPLIVFLFVFLASTPTKKLSLLPIPTIPHVAFSGPLALISTPISVLGAQDIDILDFVQEINLVRQQAGARPLRISTVLTHAAQRRAHVIRKYQNFSHQDPHEGIELGTVLPQLDYHFVYASENIGMGGLSAKDFVNGFMHSRSHKENLLDPRLTETGVAIVEGPYQQYYVNIAVQLFAIPGGLNEYLGYSTKDKLLYEENLQRVSMTIHPARIFTQKILRNQHYSQDQITKWKKAQTILLKLVAKMRKNQRLENSDIALILEYNSLL